MNDKNNFVIDNCSIQHMYSYLCNGNKMTNNNINFYITSVQIDEITQDRNKKRKEEKLKIIANMKRIPAIAVFDLTKFNNCYFASKDNIYEKIKQDEEKIYNATRPKENLARDAIIASTCIDYGYSLITDDKHLIELVHKHSPKTQVLKWEEFVNKHLK